MKKATEKKYVRILFYCKTFSYIASYLENQATIGRRVKEIWCSDLDKNRAYGAFYSLSHRRK